MRVDEDRETEPAQGQVGDLDENFGHKDCRDKHDRRLVDAFDLFWLKW